MKIKNLKTYIILIISLSLSSHSNEEEIKGKFLKQDENSIIQMQNSTIGFRVSKGLQQR